MKSALIVSSTKTSVVFFADMLTKNAPTNISTVSTSGDAKRLIAERDFDLCIINSPLPDEFGNDLAVYISTKGLAQALLVVRSEIYDEIAAKVEDAGVITIEKPIDKALFWGAIKFISATLKRTKKVQSENARLLKQIEDIRIVDKAKCHLVAYRGMTEPQAHKYIERLAMDTRTTKRECAEDINRTFGG